MAPMLSSVPQVTAPEIGLTTDKNIAFDSTPSKKEASVVDTTISPPPDGGLKAWTQVLMGHLVLINTWGYLTSFGLFQSYYTTALNSTPSAVSWIGSVQIFCVYIIGAFSGRALDAGQYRPILIVGSLLQLIGIFMTSLSTKYWHLFLAQGVCKGLGDGLLFCPTVSLVATYFSTKRVLAMSCTASGAATGGIIFPIIARQLLPTIGFGWTVRVMGFVVLFNAIIVVSIARVRLPPRKTGPLVELAAFREPSYTLFCIGMFFNLWAVYYAYFYISSFGKDIIGVSSSTSIVLLLVMNAIGIPGRLIPALIADYFLGPVNTIVIVSLFAGTLFFCWAAISNVGSLYAFCILYGFFGAGIQSLFPASCVSLTSDPQKIGVRTGMVFTVMSIPSLTGPPIAGALIESRGGSFLYAQMFGGAAFMGGMLTLMSARVAKTGWVWRKRM
ncbi:MFS general substrate transporter [Aaosphaeria arxii CBS 175.79]|uniref:MFS general substrate transporter n=1 Tax=Aaosphaeria arxii CBS 175.79 TaxID=1450172 RepID=A0A6A5XH39_9PLEO|nr:MFS general substrate transporter [Aaosphaeria arxii CBS 175.79]KAF2011674.1 MFS general substrate transporter [Aaosphaeria arxii CBS 175.79]